MAIGPLPPVIPETAYATGAHGRPVARFDLSDGAASGAGGAGPGAAATAEAAAVLPHMTVLDRAVAAALGHQDGLAPLFASLAGLEAAPDLPEPVRRAVEALLGLRIDRPPDGATLRAAVERSGVFHEARQLPGILAAGAAGPLPVATDLKGALALLSSALAGWIGAAVREPEAAASRLKPVPPRRGLPVRGQPPERAPDAAIDEGGGGALREVAAAALGEADRAAARILLHQAAGLDDGGRADASSRPPLMLELPVAGPGGTSVVQIRIDAEDHPAFSGETPGRTHRVEIGFSVPSLGPVTARVGLLPGRRVVVGLWCEDPAGIGRIEPEVGPLRDALLAAGLEVIGIDLHLGRIPPPAQGDVRPPPHRLDVAL